MKDEEKDDGSRAAGEGPSFSSLPSPVVPLLLAVSHTAVLYLYSRTQHVVPAFIIIVIIISVDGPLMNRCENSWAGRDSRGTTKEEEDTISRQKERERGRKRTARSGRKRWTERRG